MTREEAIKSIKLFFTGIDIALSNKTKEALDVLIPELHESEDERARKGLIEALKTSKTVGELKFILPEPTREECIAYLEKQKEKEIPKWMPKFLDELRSKKHYFDWDEHRDIEGSILAIIDFIAPDYFTEKDKKEQKPADEQFPPLEGLDAIKARYYDDGFKNGFDEGVASVKPAGWSEEDEKMIRFYEMDYNNQIGNWSAKKVVEMRLAFKDWLCTRLKFIRPSWKPSEEELVALKHAGGILRDCGHGELAKEVFMIEGKLANLSVINKSIWKPSEEQMKALKYAAYHMLPGEEYRDVLFSLFKDLKKLM